jgi:putative FmdB family regulatory protein
MPTYEYACSACAHEWEFEQSIKDSPLEECPRCHERTARRQISRGTGFILKGGGWYSDLYSSASNKTGGSEGSKSESSKSEGGKKADSTPKADTSSASSASPAKEGPSSGGPSPAPTAAAA